MNTRGRVVFPTLGSGPICSVNLIVPRGGQIPNKLEFSNVELHGVFLAFVSIGIGFMGSNFSSGYSFFFKVGGVSGIIVVSRGLGICKYPRKAGDVNLVGTADFVISDMWQGVLRIRQQAREVGEVNLITAADLVGCSMGYDIRR